MSHSYVVTARTRLGSGQSMTRAGISSGTRAIHVAQEFLDFGFTFVQIKEDGKLWVRSMFIPTEEHDRIIHLRLRDGRLARVREFGARQRTKGEWVLVPAG